MSSSSGSATRMWLPREFVGGMRAASLNEFLAQHGNTYFMLIALDDRAAELSAGLTAALNAATEPTPHDGLGFVTVQRDPDKVTTQRDAADVAALLAKGRSRERALDRGQPLAIAPQMLHRTCFVCPLRKRSDKAFLNRVTVGRARNNDIVLRDESVSKFHAWFECDADGRLRVGDAGSKNGTFVSGSHIGAAGAEVPPASIIRFGSLDTTLCTPEALWQALSV